MWVGTEESLLVSGMGDGTASGSTKMDSGNFECFAINVVPMGGLNPQLLNIVRCTLTPGALNLHTTQSTNLPRNIIAVA